MATGDWYPVRLADRIPWHANFNTHAQATGASHGLTAGQLTVITRDSQNVVIVVNALEAADAYGQAMTQWKDLVLEGDLGTPLPPHVAPPAITVFGALSEASIEARTRQYAAIIKASPTYTEQIGEDYGIVAPAAAPPGDVEIRSATALSASQVAVTVSKAGFDTVALDSRRGGGGWEQLLIMTTANYTDARPPLVAGQPEQREYRCQAYEANQRVGPISPAVSVVTVP